MKTPSRDSAKLLIDEAAIRAIARQCVYVIRGCLREEEWLDAEEEFARIIAKGIFVMRKQSQMKLPD